MVPLSHVFATAIVACLACSSPLHAQDDEKASVLLVVLDDLGVEQLPRFRAAVPVRRAPTPNLERLADEGVVFHRAHGNPSCSPTRALLQTGRYAFRTGIGRNTGTGSELPLSEHTIAEVLRAGAAGRSLACGMFGKWHLYQRGREGLVATEGYEVFQGTTQNVPDHFHWTRIDAAASGVRSSVVGSASGPYDESSFTASVTRADALRWINAQSHPYFACVAFHAPHDPFQVPPYATLSAATVARLRPQGITPGQLLTAGTLSPTLAFELLIEALDTELGRLWEGIDPELRARTTLLVVGDNGTTGSLLPPPYDITRGKHSIYEPGTRIPLLAAGFGVVGRDEGCSELVDAVDLLPTIAELLGCDQGLRGAGTLDGRSFGRLLRDPEARGERSLTFSQRFEPNLAYVPDPLAIASLPFGVHDRSLSDGSVKYVRRWHAPMRIYREELYLLDVDPLEQIDLFPAFRAGQLAKELDRRARFLVREMDLLSGR
jgi:arylsulfatase A-like enzyme